MLQEKGIENLKTIPEIKNKVPGLRIIGYVWLGGQLLTWISGAKIGLFGWL
jgi:hypothetical protein